MSTQTRPPVRVAGAAAALDEVAALAGDGSGTELAAAAARLAVLASSLEVGEAADASRAAGHGVVLAGSGEGPLLAVAAFPAGEPTTIHGHRGWGVAAEVDGSCDLEAFRLDPDGRASTLGVRRLQPGEATWWTRPHDVHRQRAVAGNAAQLLLLEHDPAGSPTYQPRRVQGVGELLDRFRVAYDCGDLDELAEMYAPGVLLDANVPMWRYQAQGLDAVLEVFRQELAEISDRRVTWWRITPTPTGGLLELETRCRYHEQAVLVREANVLEVRQRDSRDEVVEQTIWCTGIWEADTLARQAAEAQMVAP